MKVAAIQGTPTIRVNVTTSPRLQLLVILSASKQSALTRDSQIESTILRDTALRIARSRFFLEKMLLPFLRAGGAYLTAMREELMT